MPELAPGEALVLKWMRIAKALRALLRDDRAYLMTAWPPPGQSVPGGGPVGTWARAQPFNPATRSYRSPIDFVGATVENIAHNADEAVRLRNAGQVSLASVAAGFAGMNKELGPPFRTPDATIGMVLTAPARDAVARYLDDLANTPQETAESGPTEARGRPSVEGEPEWHGN